MENNKRSSPVVAVDIGGTKIMTALFSADGKMLTKDIRPTLPQEGVEAVVDRLCRAIKDIVEGKNLSLSKIGAVGVASAGGIDTDRGVVVTPSPHLPGWQELPLADVVKRKLGVTTYLINDASAAALGEHCYGVGKGVNNLVLLTLGTGIGGGIIIDGKLYLGAHGGAGELGHTTVEATGPRCTCGNTGCLEKYASGTAIVADAVARIRKGEKTVLTELSAGEPETITVEMIGQAAKNGDKLAQDVISRAAFYIGVAMVNIANIFNPQMIIIAGGVASLGEMIISPGRKMVAERAFSINSQGIKIVKTQLGDEAGVYGAFAFTLDMKGNQ